MASMTASLTQRGCIAWGPITAWGLESDPAGAKAGDHSLGAGWPPAAIPMEGRQRDTATGMEGLAALAGGLVFARDLSLAADRRVAVMRPSPICVSDGRRNRTSGTAAAWGL